MLDFSELAPEGPRLLTRLEFEKLGQTDLFDDDERIELLRGVLVRMTPPVPSPRHDAAIHRLTRRLVLAVGERAWVRVCGAFAASDDSETIPDLAVIPLGDYERDFPQGALLLVEVAVTSLRKDRRIKTSIYAEGDVAEYWIVDVDGRAIEVHREAREGAFTDVRRYADGEVIQPLRFPETSIAVSDVLAPPAR
jgi:Uma2 family endonuclease